MRACVRGRSWARTHALTRMYAHMHARTHAPSHAHTPAHTHKHSFMFKYVIAIIYAFLQNKPELIPIMLPTYPLGCKRVILAGAYLKVLFVECMFLCSYVRVLVSVCVCVCVCACLRVYVYMCLRACGLACLLFFLIVNIILLHFLGVFFCFFIDRSRAACSACYRCH